MSIERIPIKIFTDDNEVSIAVSNRIAQVIREKAREGKPAVLGLATGHTPVKVYRELIRMHQKDNLDFSGVITFNLDEYWPISHTAIQSYHVWMQENFFNHVNITPENIHIPSGEWTREEVKERCREYEEAIDSVGGIDIQILGIGRTGHIGFNEPGSLKTGKTRLVYLDIITRKDAASDFCDKDNVPGMAITMGVATIMKAREICLMAFGEHKAQIIRCTVEEKITSNVPASYLQEHANTTFFLDRAAAAELTRVVTPWVLGPCTWDEKLQRHAVIWLARKLDKPILKLTDEDYIENDLFDLVKTCGGSYNINLTVFKHLMNTITGWPGGKTDKKRVLILSPHPDDDVISMGGTMVRLVEQGHETHVAYMVSGYLSVFDHLVSRYGDFVRNFNDIFGLTPDQSAAIEQHIDKFLRNKRPGDVDSSEIQAIKTLIRKTEALDAAKYCGLAEENMHFLDMPFYNTGMAQKLSIEKDDIEAVLTILTELNPDMVFAAGDMSDPHGTHRLCLEAFFRALDIYTNTGKKKPAVWLYRGAWQEWNPEEIDMVVPLSPDELLQKRYAIFRHESQKDRAMFPGPYDTREFWQRAEDRNISTAEIYDQLGLPEYHAIEAFVRYK